MTERSNNQSLLKWLPYVAVVISCMPIFFGGFPVPNTAWPIELVRTAEFKYALASGQWPPYWGGNLYFGYGSPIFLFYAPVFSFTSTLFAEIFGSFFMGGSASILFFTLVSAFTMDRMMRAAMGGEGQKSFAAARVAAYVFVLNPYILGDKLLRSANAEFAALCIAPLALHGLLLAGRDTRRGFILLASGLGLTILSHNLTALIVMAMLVAGAFTLYLPSGRLKTWRAIVGGTALGLALAAFFWVPALSLKHLVRTDQLSTGWYDFHNNFPPIDTLFSYDHFYATGLLTPALLIVSFGTVCFARKYNFLGRRFMYFALSGALLSLFLQTEASILLWKKVPYLPLFQFPWRMMGPLAIFTSIASGLAFAHLQDWKRGKTITAEFIVLLLCIINALPLLASHKPLERSFVNQLPQLLSREAIRSSYNSGTELNEYLPRLAQTDTQRFQMPGKGPVVHAEAAVDIITKLDTGTRIVLDVEAARMTRLSLARWAFPGWELRINGRAGEVMPNSYGSIEILVPEGKNNIELNLKPPMVRRVSLWISLTALLLLILAALKWPRRLWGFHGVR